MARPEVQCCVPTMQKFPSGFRWAHARNCRLMPGQKVRTKAEQASKDAHPAGKGLSSGWA